MPAEVKQVDMIKRWDTPGRMWRNITCRRVAPHNSAARNAVQFANRLHLTEVWRVDIERITGKARAAQRWVPGVTLREDAEMPVQPWLRDAPK